MGIAERKATDQALVESEERYRILVETSPDVIAMLDLDANIIVTNRQAAQMLGYESADHLVGKNGLELVAPAARPNAVATLRKVLEAGGVRDIHLTMLKKDGTTFPVELSASLIVDTEQKKPKGVIVVLRDITDRMRLETQLLQAQKMEAIGVLAGGVAHDFNNLLTVIIGYSDFLQDKFCSEDPKRSDLEQIKKAANGAASLISQLLAFSRKQILQPRILDLNDLVADVEKMLRRLIGEDISLVTVAAPGLGRVQADPGQIQQVIMNLAVNARDAMPRGGKLTIETANVDIDENYAHAHAGGRMGPYVMLAVSDNGCGMDEETKARIFEPFFTTKGPGKGTGLGLSTIYGIVKQSDGFIWVYSEPGKGTTFKIYLPRVDQEPEKLPDVDTAEQPPRASETILLVEDDLLVRNLAARMLRERGYTVIETPDGEEALRVARESTQRIDLLLTDVVMPQTSGKILASRIQALRPDTKVLFVSGYTGDAIVRHGVLDSNTPFLQKPFTAETLARKVREVLKCR